MKSSRNKTIDFSIEESWMLQLCDVMDIFYSKEIAKIENGIDYFAKVRAFWKNKQE